MRSLIRISTVLAFCGVLTGAVRCAIFNTASPTTRVERNCEDLNDKYDAASGRGTPCSWECENTNLCARTSSTVSNMHTGRCGDNYLEAFGACEVSSFERAAT